MGTSLATEYGADKAMERGGQQRLDALEAQNRRHGLSYRPM
jgi:hypothetical protein